MFRKGVGESEFRMLGIDVSKDHLCATLLDPLTRQVVFCVQVENSPDGVASLLHKTPAGCDWVLEPTGRYSLFVVQQAMRAGQSVLLAPPRKAKAFLSSLPTRAKTDRLDSVGLAHFASSVALSPYPVKEPLVEQIEQLLCARRSLSQAITRLRLQQAELAYASAYLKEAVASLKQQQKALDAQLATLSKQHKGFGCVSELLKVPGIGSLTAIAVTARLESKRFAHPDAFVAYIGLDVSTRQSGKRAGKQGLSRQGDAELRRLLYVCAQASLRAKDSPFKLQYERERAKGLSSTQALCAVARKLAKLCWSLHAHGSAYDAKRVYQAPKKASETSPQEGA